MEKEKLFEMAGEVYRNVPAYIDLARDRDIDIASLTEFGQLPIMEKKYMIDHEMGNIAPENNNTIYILMNYETQVDIIAGVVFPALGFQG